MTADVYNLSYIGVLKQTAHKLFVEYLERSITHGLRMIRRTEGDSYGRYIWLGCLAFIFIQTHLDVYNLAIDFMQAPTEIRLSPKVVHVKNVLFPAVAICSNNKISKKALNNYAEKLAGLFERNINASLPDNDTYFDSTGLRQLQLVLQDDPADYTLKEYACDGLIALLFYPDDYADAEKGSVSKVFVGYNEEYEVSIQPEILEGSSRMRQFSSKMRHCYFLEEGQELLKQYYYSFNECMLDCRVRSVANYCGCMVPILPGYIANVSYCVLLDLPCINLWKTIWWQWNTFDFVFENRRFRPTLEICKHCLPGCNVLSYKLNVNSRPLNIPTNQPNFSVGILNGLTTSKPTTAIRFFYKSVFSQVKTHDISGDWIVLLARYGGICSIMYGFSIVAIIEIIYFVTGKWFALWWKSLAECYRHWLRRRVEHEREQELYWDELQPKIDFPIK